MGMKPRAPRKPRSAAKGKDQRAEVPAMPPHVAEVFAGFPPEARQRLLELRALIFATADSRPEVGSLTETLKWSEPAYLTEETRSGSTLRLGWRRATPANVYLYFNCQTDLVSSFRALFDDQLVFEGNRALALAMSSPLPRTPLTIFIEAALTYHLERAHQHRGDFGSP